MATGYDQLPEAILEETIHPDDVILIPQDDGTVHMLLYAGKTENGYVALKYVILDAKHVAGIASVGVDRVAATYEREHSGLHTETVVPFEAPVQRAPLLDLATLPQPRFVDDDVIRR